MGRPWVVGGRDPPQERSSAILDLPGPRQLAVPAFELDDAATLLDIGRDRLGRLPAVLGRDWRWQWSFSGSPSRDSTFEMR
jgi:hypothetical protein